MKKWVTNLKKWFNGEVDLTTGNLFLKMLLFTIPIVLLSLLQLLYTSADLLVVNYFGGHYKSFIAVSSNGSLINLIIGLFVGVSVGANVVVAKAKGEKNQERGNKALQSSIVLSMVFGVVISVVGYFLAPYMLEAMAVGDDVLPLATIYLQYYFIGLPFLMIFNFGSAVLRAVGDSKKPLYILLVCGLANIGMNLWFVIAYQMDVAGVGLATLICEILEATIILIVLFRNKDGFIQLRLKGLFTIHKEETLDILRNGIPAGLQSLVFSLSNVFIQREVDIFGYAAMAGNSASSQVEGYLYVILNGVSVAVVAIVAQNYGAGNEKNLNKILPYACLTVLILGLSIGGIFSLCRSGLISIFINRESVDTDEEFIAATQYGEERLVIICMTYFLCGFMDSESAYCRGLGHSLIPTLVTFFGCCLLRIVFIFTIFKYLPYFHTLGWLWASWPISWVVTDLAYLIFIPRYKKEAFSNIASRSMVKAS